MKRLRRVVANKVTANKVADDYRGDYMLLGRLRSDCEYFLQRGHNTKHLWAGNIEDQISMMYEIYDRLPQKPDWLTRKDIDIYHKEMKKLSTDIITSSYNNDDDEFLNSLWDLCYDISGLQDIDYEQNDEGIIFIYSHSGDLEKRISELTKALNNGGYHATFLDSNGTNVLVFDISQSVYSSEYLDDDEDYITEIPQEYTSKNTSININKVPAIFRSVRNWTPGTINVDYSGGRSDTATEYLSQYDVQNLIYDPYNRTREHNSEVIRTIRKAGGADTATCSNVLNVIKEPEVRTNALINISKLVKPGGDVYFTTYEGSGKGDERPTGKENYQLNRKTDWYLDEIREVFPDAIRKGKLIIATNRRYINSSSDIDSSIDMTNGRCKMVIQVDSGINANGFILSIIDKETNDILFREEYAYGYNASYNKTWASVKKPYVSDIINKFRDQYNIYKDDIEVTAGKNHFKGTNVSDEQVQNFISKYIDKSSIESTRVISSTGTSGDILSFTCPICHNDTVYSTEKDIYHVHDVDYKEIFMCDECGAELEAYPQYDGTIDFIPLMDDEY